MFIQQNKHFDIILENDEKNKPKKSKSWKIIIPSILLIITLVLIFIFIIILKKDINNCKSLINKNTGTDQNNFETIFNKFKEIEEKYSDEIISLKKENKDLKDSFSLKDYLIETQYKIINELTFQIDEMQNKNSEQKDENQNEDLEEIIRKIYNEMQNNDSKELMILKGENQNKTEDEDIKELIRQIIIDIQDENLKK